MTMNITRASKIHNVLLLLLLFLLGSGTSNGEDVKKTVLYLNSYHHGYKWSDAEFNGIRTKLDSGPYRIDLQVEYLDAKKYNTAPVIQGLSSGRNSRASGLMW